VSRSKLPKESQRLDAQGGELGFRISAWHGAEALVAPSSSCSRRSGFSITAIPTGHARTRAYRNASPIN
jgi:hypothetical protein